MVKNFLFLAMFVLVGMTSVNAQRVALVDVNKILEALPEYATAQTQLDQMAAKWRQQVDQEHDKIKGMYSKYQAEQVLMSDEMRVKKEEEIMAAEKAARRMQKDKFGPEGALFVKRAELIQPIQDKVYNAIQDYANQRGFDIILDMAGSAGVIFAGEKYNKTDDVIAKLKN